MSNLGLAWATRHRRSEAARLRALRLPLGRRLAAQVPAPTGGYDRGLQRRVHRPDARARPWRHRTPGSELRRRTATRPFSPASRPSLPAIAEPELAVYRTGARRARRASHGHAARATCSPWPNPHFSLDTLLAYLVDLPARRRQRLLAQAPEPADRRPATSSSSADLARPGSRRRPSTGSCRRSSTVYRYWYTAQPVRRPAACRTSSTSATASTTATIGRLLAASSAGPRDQQSDDQATRYADRLLANLAINGLTLSFDKDAPPIDQATADAAQGADHRRRTAATTSDAAAVLAGRQAQRVSASAPSRCDMKTLHRVPEERISAGARRPGDRGRARRRASTEATFSNVREAREMFTEAKLLPLWRLHRRRDHAPAGARLHERCEHALSTSTPARSARSADDLNAEACRLKIAGGGRASSRPTRPAPRSATSRQRRRLPRRRCRSRRRAGSRRCRRSAPAARKAAEDLPGRYDAMRAAELPTWESELIAFLASQERRVLRRLRAGADTADGLVDRGRGDPARRDADAAPAPRARRGLAAWSSPSLGIAFRLDDPATLGVTCSTPRR